MAKQPTQTEVATEVSTVTSPYVIRFDDQHHVRQCLNKEHALELAKKEFGNRTFDIQPL